MHRMMHEIVTDVLSSQPDIEVVANGVSPVVSGMKRTPDDTSPDVIILGERSQRAAVAYEDLLYSLPRTKVLAISDDGRESFLYELRPREVALGQLSAEGLLSAVRGTHHADTT
jgi:hypothetical protein